MTYKYVITVRRGGHSPQCEAWPDTMRDVEMLGGGPRIKVAPVYGRAATEEEAWEIYHKRVAFREMRAANEEEGDDE